MQQALGKRPIQRLPLLQQVSLPMELLQFQWTYLVGESRRADMGFNGVFCGFVVLGCMLQLDAVLAFSDALVFLICVPNLLGLYVLAPVVRQRLDRYEPPR